MDRGKDPGKYQSIKTWIPDADGRTGGNIIQKMAEATRDARPLLLYLRGEVSTIQNEPI